jgi:hypothetical protein
MRARTSKKTTIAIAHAIPFIINKTLDPRSPRLYPTKANIEDIIKPTAGVCCQIKVDFFRYKLSEC